jgi:hypothetical protein
MALATLVRGRSRLAAISVISVLTLGGVIVPSAESAAAPDSSVVQLSTSTVSGSAPTDLGGSQVAMSAVVIPIGMKQHAGETLPAPSLGTWTAPAGASYRHALVNRSALVASWARVNGGNLNVVITAIGTDAEQHITTSFRTTRSGSSVELAAPLLARSGRWARSVPFTHPKDAYPYDCSYSTTATQGDTGRVGQIATWNDENGDFSYGKTADTDAGISFTDGSSGSLHISNSQSDTFSEHYRGDTLNYVLSDFNSGTYNRNAPPSGQYYCDDPSGSVHPYQWAGGISEGATISGSNLEDQCATHPTTTSITVGKNGQFDSASASAGGWSVGLTAFGVGVSMDSGYSNNVGFDINTLAASTNHWMCGRTAAPIDADDVWTGPNT